MFSIGRKLLLLLGCTPFVITAAVANAQSYPNRPVRIVVGLPAGGNMDALSRLLADRLSASLGQPVVVENKPGATGMIAAAAVAKSEPDGHTLLFSISSFVQAVHLTKDPPYRIADFAPLAQLADLPVAFGISASLPAETLSEFISLVKAKPGAYSYGSYGAGSSAHIMGEMLKRTAQIDMVHVAYKGESPAIADLLGGHVHAAFGSAGAMSQHPEKIRFVAVSGSHRLTRYPDTPTFDEAGVPLKGLTGWAGSFAPAKTPKPIIEKLSSEIRRIVAMPDVESKILDLGFEPPGGSKDSFAEFVSAQSDTWKAAIRDGKIETN